MDGQTALELIILRWNNAIQILELSLVQFLILIGVETLATIQLAIIMYVDLRTSFLYLNDTLLIINYNFSKIES